MNDLTVVEKPANRNRSSQMARQRVGPNLSSQSMGPSPLREIYVSTDIETDGPVAGKHSMLSIGSAAYLANYIDDAHLVSIAGIVRMA